MYTLRFFIALVAAVLAACGPGAESENNGNQMPPNIIVILADDAGVEAFEAYGGLSYETPNITELAGRGVKFTRAFSQPVCTPSRVQLLTGKHNYRNYEAFGWLDPFGYNIIRDEITVHDFHATIMHLMGVHHEKLRYRYQGRDFRLTDVHGHVVKNILA